MGNLNMKPQSTVLYARLQHLHKYNPGEPTVMVKSTLHELTVSVRLMIWKFLVFPVSLFLMAATASLGLREEGPVTEGDPERKGRSLTHCLSH